MVRNLRGSRILAAGVVVLLLGAVYGLAGLRHTMSLSRRVGAAGCRGSRRSPRCSGSARPPAASTSPGGGIAVMTSPASSGSASAGAALSVTRLTGSGSAAAGPRVLSVTQAGVPRLAQVTVDRATARKTARTQQGRRHQGGQHDPAGRRQRGPSRATGPRKRPGRSRKHQPSRAARWLATALSGGVVIQASGSLAEGLEAEQTSAGSLPTAACSSPGTNFWFSGPGQRTAGRIELYLMNAGSQVADVVGGHRHRCRAAAGDHRHRDQRAAARHDRPVAGRPRCAIPGLSRCTCGPASARSRPPSRRAPAGGAGDLAAARAGARQAPGHPRAARGGRHPGAVHRGARGEGRDRPGDGCDLTGQLPADRGQPGSTCPAAPPRRSRCPRWAGSPPRSG